MPNLIHIKSNWRLTEGKDIYRRVFNAFFMDYKTGSDVANEIYADYDHTNKRKKRIEHMKEKNYPGLLHDSPLMPKKPNTGYISRCFNDFKESGYLEDPRIEYREALRGGKKRKKHPYRARVKVYRGNLNPVFEWLDERITGLLLREGIKDYLTELFKTLEDNNIPRSVVIFNYNAGFITNMQNLLLTILSWVKEDEHERAATHYDEYFKCHFYFEREDGTQVILPDPVPAFRHASDDNFIDMPYLKNFGYGPIVENGHLREEDKVKTKAIQKPLNHELKFTDEEMREAKEIISKYGLKSAEEGRIKLKGFILKRALSSASMREKIERLLANEKKKKST